MNKVIGLLVGLFSILFCVNGTAQIEDTIALKTKDGQLIGSLLYPEAGENWPVVVFVSGSGPTDRDGNNPQMKNNGLRMLAEALCQSGVASLRYDKRGIAASQDAMGKESDLRFEHYADDLSGWIEMLIGMKKFEKIGVAGHSEGSLLGILSAQNGNVDFFISLAGAGRPIDEILGEQLRKQPGLDYDLMYSLLNSLKAGLSVQQPEGPLGTMFRESVQPYMKSWMQYDPGLEIKKLNIPILIIQGTSDIQVLVSDADRLKAHSDTAELLVIHQMNHVLKTSEEDYVSNLKTYYDPDLPLSDGLTWSIINFLKNYEILVK